MNENEYVVRTVCSELEKNRPVVLVTITGIEGSVPRHSGTKMVVSADGKSYGTIGGSLIEAAAARASQKVFTTKKSRVMTYELSGNNANAPGMICGGKVELLLEYVPASEANIKFANLWRDAIHRGKDCYLLTNLQGSGEKPQVLGHAILYADGSVSDSRLLLPSEVEDLKGQLHTISTTAVLPLKNTRVLVDKMRRLKTVYCFGAGHVAVPTAHLAALAGFRVVVMDDRPEFANAERFPDAQEIRVIGNFNHAFEGLEIDADSYIVIVTRGHQYDREVLGQALNSPAGYIGMISSRRKRETIYNALMAQGISQERLEKVHSPIGIAIGGETPEEIAVSIVAELISVRSAQNT
jgi:xanthine dehydrogenase accessory factor